MRVGMRGVGSESAVEWCDSTCHREEKLMVPATIKKEGSMLAAAKEIKRRIPYLRCFEEEGMIETSKGEFSKAYFIEGLSDKSIKNMNNKMFTKKFQGLLNNLPGDVNVQFIFHNEQGDTESFLKQFLVVPKKIEARGEDGGEEGCGLKGKKCTDQDIGQSQAEDIGAEDYGHRGEMSIESAGEINCWIDEYNKTITKAVAYGNNSIKKDNYMVLSLKARRPEEARKTFKEIDEIVRREFGNVYGIKIRRMDIGERLSVMYAMFNPGKKDFGNKADLRGDGVFRLKDMKKMGLTTKDCIAPATWDCGERDVMKIGDMYVRAFFINSLPEAVPMNLIPDITNISSNMVFSAMYENVDPKVGFGASSRAVTGNTLVKQENKRDTFKDRREKNVIRTEMIVDVSEKAYFERSALSTFKEAVAGGNKTLMASFVLVLYSTDLEGIERDTKLLHISCAKFACNIKPLDLQQAEGFCSVLPLGRCFVDVKRLFDVSRIAAIAPINIHQVMQKNGLFCGINAINDNSIYLNRKNSPNLCGMITGTEHSGKTFQNMREIFNAMISSENRVYIISGTDDYDCFVRKLGGVVVENPDRERNDRSGGFGNPFWMVEHYGMMNPDKYSKALMLEALFETLCAAAPGLRSKTKPGGPDDTEYERADLVAKETESLLMEDINLEDAEEVVRILQGNPEKYANLREIAEEILKYADHGFVDSGEYENARLVLFKVGSTEEKVVLMDSLFNQGILDKMNNVSDWIFIDPVDDLIESEQTNAFLIDYIEKMNALKNVLTMVVQSSVKLFSESVTALRFGDVIGQTGYFKLLNQGVIERRCFSEILNIPQTLVNYITGAELGKGLILTSASNYAFDDNFDEGEEGFYRLFKEE